MTFSRVRFALIIAAYTALSFLLNGYQVLVADQWLYFPSMFHAIAGVTTAPSDMLSVFNQNSMTLFDEFVTLCVRLFSHIDVIRVLVVLAIAERAITYVAISKIARAISGSVLFSYIAPALFLASQPIFGTGKDTLSGYLHPWTFALAFALLSFAFFLERKYVWSSAILAWAVLMHPLSAAPWFVLMFVMLVADIPKPPRRAILFFWIAPVAAFGVLASIGRILSGGGLFQKIDPTWMQAVLAHAPYVFVANWGLIPFAYLLPMIACFCIAHTTCDDERSRRLLVAAFVLPILALIAAYGTGDLLHLGFFTGAQLSRALVVWKYLLVIFFGWQVFRHAREHPSDIAYLFFGGGVLVSLAIREVGVWPFLPPLLLLWSLRYAWMRTVLRGLRLSADRAACALYIGAWAFLILLTALHPSATISSLVLKIIGVHVLALFLYAIFLLWRKIPPKFLTVGTIGCVLLAAGAIYADRHAPISVYPDVSPAMTSLCDWLSVHTPQDALILTDPNATDGNYVRLLCNRGVYVMENDGAQAILNRPYALEWARRLAIVEPIFSSGAFSREQLHAEGITYIVSSHTLSGSGDVVYDNATYVLTRVR